MTKQVINGDFYCAGDYAVNLLAINPIPPRALLVLEYDTGRFKFGDGARRYNDLPYAVPSGIPGLGTVTSVGIVPPSKGITVSGGPVTASGAITLALADDLAAVENLATTGPVKRTGTAVWSTGPINLATEVTGVLPGANGGAAAITITAGANVTVTGTAPNYIISSTASGGGSGTVTSVTVTTANGVSASVANQGTTPALSFTLGAITPTTVAASGNISGYNLSGTNTGDQTFLLTGDVTGAGTSSVPTTLTASGVTPGTYTNANVTVDAKGRITAAANGTSGGGGSGTVTSVNAAAPAEGITISGGPVTSSGTLTFALANDLAALEGLTSTGLARRTGPSTWTTGSLVALGSEVSGLLPVLSGGTGTASPAGITIAGTGGPTASGTFPNQTLTFSAGSGASTTQPGEMISGYLGAPVAKTYAIVVNAPHAGVITQTSTIAESGTGTFTFAINGTPLGGTANSVSTTQNAQTQASANVFATGDKIQVTPSSLSKLVGATFTIKYTRTLS